MKSQNIYSPIFENKDELITNILNTVLDFSKTTHDKIEENHFSNLTKNTLVIIEIELKKILNREYHTSNNLVRSVNNVLRNTEDSTLNPDHHFKIFLACRRVLIEKILSIGYEKIVEKNIINSVWNLIDLSILTFYKKYEKESTKRIVHDKNTINNLKIVKNDLQKQLNLTYQLIKDSPVGLVGCDSELTIKIWNPIAENLTGYHISDIIGKSIFNIFTTPSQSLIRSQLSTETHRRKRMKLNIQTRDGGIFNAYVFMSRLKTEIKQKVQYIFNIVDLSKDEKLKTQLEKIEQLGAIARLSDAIMHDVRNPINSLALNIDVLTQLHTKRSFHSEEMSDILVKINRQISTLAQNLNRYVGYSKITELKLEPIDVGETLNELILDTHLLLTEKRILLNFRQPKSQLLINGDWDQIIRVFRNLIDNAIDAIGTKGSIDVRVRKRNNNIMISIVDSGSGINPENLLNVFKPYFTTKDKGSGLGLFIVREIVRAHHGRVTCKSSVDQGTRFTVSIPAIVP